MVMIFNPNPKGQNLDIGRNPDLMPKKGVWDG